MAEYLSTAIGCAGQGSQDYQKMRDVLLEGGLSESLELYQHALEKNGSDIDLVHILRVAQSNDDLRESTTVNQLLASAFAKELFEELRREQKLPRSAISAAFGMSVGEIPARHIAGQIDAETMAHLGTVRALAMEDALKNATSVQYAVMLKDPASAQEILRLLDQPPYKDKVWIGNYNTPTQIVVAGYSEETARFVESIRSLADEKKGVIKLNTAGAFHTPIMAPAAERFGAALDRAKFYDAFANLSVPANYEGEPTEDVRQSLLLQVTNPVRMVDNIRWLRAHGHRAVITLDAAGHLAGIVRKNAPDFKVFNMSSRHDVAEFDPGELERKTAVQVARVVDATRRRVGLVSTELISAFGLMEQTVRQMTEGKTVFTRLNPDNIPLLKETKGRYFIEAARLGSMLAELDEDRASAIQHAFFAEADELDAEQMALLAKHANQQPRFFRADLTRLDFGRPVSLSDEKLMQLMAYFTHHPAEAQALRGEHEALSFLKNALNKGSLAKLLSHLDADTQIALHEKYVKSDAELTDIERAIKAVQDMDGKEADRLRNDLKNRKEQGEALTPIEEAQLAADKFSKTVFLRDVDEVPCSVAEYESLVLELKAVQALGEIFVKEHVTRDRHAFFRENFPTQIGGHIPAEVRDLALMGIRAALPKFFGDGRKKGEIDKKVASDVLYYTFATLYHALNKVGLLITEGDDAGTLKPEFGRAAAFIATGIGGGAMIEKAAAIAGVNGDLKNGVPAATYFTSALASMLAGLSAQIFYLTNASDGSNTACASGLTAVYHAANAIGNRRTNLVATGGFDEYAEMTGALGGFANMGATTRTLNPNKPYEVYGLNQDGFRGASGGGASIIMDMQTANDNNVPVLAEVFTGASTCMSMRAGEAPTLGTREGQMTSIRDAFEQAGITMADIDAVFVHGTGTPNGDPIEADVLKLLALEAGMTAEDLLSIDIVTPKAQLGHQLGGAGAVSLALAGETMRSGMISVNTDYIVNTGYGLNVVQKPKPFTSRLDCTKPGKYILVLAYGFGGHNYCVILKRPEADSASQAPSIEATTA